MPFITPPELKTVAYQYQVTQITEADNDIVLQAIAAAEAELRSYLTPNNRKAWQDGRPLYDVEAILAATGTQRNALLLEQGKTIALWYLIRLCNVDMLYEHARERYDRAIAWLDKLATGQVTLNLPLLQPGGGIGDEDSGSLPFRMGGRKKWHHE